MKFFKINYLIAAIFSFSMLSAQTKSEKLSISEIFHDTNFDIKRPLNIDSILNQEGENSIEKIDDETIFRTIFSKDGKWAVALSQKEEIYRRSYRSKAYLLKLSEEKEILQKRELSTLGKIMLPSFSLDSKKLSYVRDNNIYYIDLQGENLDNFVEKAITTDGLQNKIINGYCDWVYEEEFSFWDAKAFSSKGRYLAYLRFDESEVKQYSMSVYEDLYPSLYTYKYPKAGEDNSVLSLNIYDFEKAKTYKICQTKAAWDSLSESIAYIPNFKFLENSDKLIFFTLNRRQNNLRIWNFDLKDLSVQEKQIAKTGINSNAKKIYQEISDTYVDVENTVFKPINNDEEFIISSEKNKYHHLYLYSINGEEKLQLTKGSFDVSSFVGYDKRRSKVYFLAHNSAPYNTELMCVNLDGSNQRLMLKDLQAKGGTTSVKFSNDYKKAVVNHSSHKSAPVYCLYSIDNESEHLLSVLENNSKLNELIAEKGGEKTFGILPLKPYKLFYWTIKPKNMEKNKKYPVLMFLYGGPGSRQVVNQYGGRDYWFYSMLAEKGYIILCVDARGTGGRGSEFKKSTYLQLGKYETEDQIAVANYIKENWDYVSGNRIGIWGWSYGGFMSSSCLFKGNETFRMAMAVAPVTSWRYYDNVYTERFMRTPFENPEGYDLNSPINHTEKLKGKYLLVHGSLDDNVHIQNSLELIKSLQKNNKMFSFHVYPNKNHSIVGGNAREHLYTMMYNFIRENL